MHPPLFVRRSRFRAPADPLRRSRAKLLLAFAGWIIGYDGSFEFENIGDSYIENKVPYIALRVLPVIFGSLIPVMVFAIMRTSGYPRVVALLTASFVLFGQSCRRFSSPGSYTQSYACCRQRSHRANALDPPRRAVDPLHGDFVLLLHSVLQASL